MNGAIDVYIVPVGRDGANIYPTAQSNQVIGHVRTEGQEGLIYPEATNNRHQVVMATGIEGWIEKKTVRLNPLVVQDEPSYDEYE